MAFKRKRSNSRESSGSNRSPPLPRVSPPSPPRDSKRLRTTTSLLKGRTYPPKSPFGRARVRRQIQEHRASRDVGKYILNEESNRLFGGVGTVSGPSVYHSVNHALYRKTLRFLSAEREMYRRQKMAKRKKRTRTQKIASEQEGSSSIESSSSDDGDIESLNRKINLESSEEDENDDSRSVRKEEDSQDNPPVTEEDVMDSLNPNTWTFKHFTNSERFHTAVLDLGTHTTTQLRGLLAPDDYLFQIRGSEDLAVPPMVPHSELPHASSSELLSALTVYAMELYNVLGYNQVTGFLRGDETALLALGVLVEEYVKEMLGPTGHLAYMEYEEPVGVSREARWQMAVPDEDNEEGHSSTEEDESDPDDVPGVDGPQSYDIRGFKNLTMVSHTGMSREKSKKFVYVEHKQGARAERKQKSGHKTDKNEKNSDHEENGEDDDQAENGDDEDDDEDYEDDEGELEDDDVGDKEGGKKGAASNDQERDGGDPIVDVDDEDDDEAEADENEDERDEEDDDDEDDDDDEEEEEEEDEGEIKEEDDDEDEEDEDEIIADIPVKVEDDDEEEFRVQEDDEAEDYQDEDDEVINKIN